MIYFDHAASTPIRDSILNTYLESLRADFANSSASHRLGVSLNEKINHARSSLLKFLKLREDEFKVYFTSSATESNNLVLKTVQEMSKENGGYCLISKTDHPSINYAAEMFFSKERLLFWNHESNGHLGEMETSAKINLVSLSRVNGSLGTIFQLEKIEKLKRENPSLFVHLDLSQSFGKVEDQDLSFADFLSISSHKIGAPKGVSALIVRKNIKLVPLFFGGGQEDNMRPSTLNTPAIVAFGATIEEIKKGQFDEIKKMREIKEYIQTELLKENPEIKIPFTKTSPHILTLIFEGISTDIIQRHLQLEEVVVATSAACSSKLKKSNPVYSAVGIPENLHHNLLRISFGHSSTLEEAKNFVAKFNNVVKRLRLLC